MKTYLSIDRGASNTDFAVVDSDYRILLKRCITTRQWNSIIETYREILNELSPDYFVFTGSSNNMPDEIEELFLEGQEKDKGEEYDEAEKKYIEIISLDSKNIKAFKMLGRLYGLEDH